VSLDAVLRRCLSLVEGRRGYGDLEESIREEIVKLESRQAIRSRAFERRAAVEGEKFLWPVSDGVGGTDVEMVVRAKSPGEEGRWWCLPCGVACAHNLEKDSHCAGPAPRGVKRRLLLSLGDARSRHVLAWRNYTSGHVEVP